MFQRRPLGGIVSSTYLPETFQGWPRKFWGCRAHTQRPRHLFGLPRFSWMYVVTPAFLGTVILVLIGCITNNFVGKRHYPQYWFLGISKAFIHCCRKLMILHRTEGGLLLASCAQSSSRDEGFSCGCLEHAPGFHFEARMRTPACFSSATLKLAA